MESLTVDKLNLRSRAENGKIYFTVADLEAFPEWPDGPLLELVNGDLYVVPSPNTEHQDLSAEILYQIKSFLKTKAIGRVFSAPYDVMFSDEDSAVPDIVYVAKENEKIITSKNIQGTPDLIVEITSNNRARDFILKRNLYERFKTKEYWIVDPKEKKVLIYLLNRDGAFDPPREHPFGEILTVKSITGLSLQL